MLKTIIDVIEVYPDSNVEVRQILDENKAERHIRGGLATKMKYSHHEEAI